MTRQFGIRRVRTCKSRVRVPRRSRAEEESKRFSSGYRAIEMHARVKIARGRRGDLFRFVRGIARVCMKILLNG